MAQLSTDDLLRPSEALLAARAATDEAYRAALRIWTTSSQYGHSMARHFVDDVHGGFRKYFSSICDEVKQRLSSTHTTSLSENDLWLETKIVPRFRRGVESLLHHHRMEDVRVFPDIVRKHPELKEHMSALELDHQSLHPLEDIVFAKSKPFSERCLALIGFTEFLSDHLKREEMLLVPVFL